MSTLIERMEELSAATGWDVGAMAEIAGVSSSAVSQWFGKGSKIIHSIGNIEAATKLAAKSGFSAVWLAKGTLPKMAKDLPPPIGNTSPGPELRGKVPVISWIQAGEWCTAADPHPPGVAESWLDCPVNHSNGTFALKVRGDSMTAPHGNSRSYPS